MNKNKNEKQSYAPPQCEVLAVQCEGVIALSLEYKEWKDLDWVE